MRQEAPSTTGQIAPEAWRALSEAARRAGLPLDQWLRAQLMGTTAAGTPPAGLDGLNNLAELRRRIEELAGQIGRLDLTARAEPPLPSVSAERATTEPRAPEPQAAHAVAATPSEDRLAAAMREIDHRLAALQLSRRRTLMAEAAPSPAAIEAAVAEIAARQTELDRDGLPQRRAEVPIPRREPAPAKMAAPDAAPLPPGSADPEGTPHDLFRESLKHAAPPPETAPPLSPTPAPLPHDTLTALQDELAGLRRSVAALAPRRSVDELQRVVQQLVERVERSDTRDDNMRAALASLREMIDGLRLPAPPEVLLGRIGALERKVDIVNAKVVDGATVARLQAQIGEVRDLLARALSSDSLRLLAEQVSLLATRVAEMAASEDETVRTAFGALERRIDTLSERIAAPAPSLPLDDLLGRLDAIQADLVRARHDVPAGLATLFDGLSERLERIERPQAPADDGARFEALGRQIEALSHRLGAGGSDFAGEFANQLSGQLAGIERAVNDLFIQMEETRASLLDASRPRPPSGTGGDPETLTALIRREIAALESQRATETMAARASAAAEAAVAAELASLAAASRPAPSSPEVLEVPVAEPTAAEAVFTPAPASIPKAFEPQLMRAALEALSRTAAAAPRPPAAPPPQ